MWHLRVILGFAPDVTVTCEVDIAVGFVLANTGENVGSICSCSTVALWLIFAMRQAHLSSHISNMLQVTW